MSGELRSWGFWTQAKLSILKEYLERFLQASGRQTERVYLDGFAGEGAGLDRQTQEEFLGSARIAIEAGGGRGFTKLRFFELDADRAARLETRLREEFPGRDIKVEPGDCNKAIPDKLQELRGLSWAPTFAFLDPDGMELAWDTLVALADHKRGYRSARSAKPEYKTELWMLFPSAGLPRTLALEESKLSPGDEARATRMFGCDDWKAIYDARAVGDIGPEAAREEYVNLMRWRLEKELGYRYTHAFEVKNTNGVPLYHMIFATDNEAGTRIMEAVYSQAARGFPEMQKEAKDRKKGQVALDFDVPTGGLDATYQHEPPWEPRV
jgi:three-Cys-motif partner protein